MPLTIKTTNKLTDCAEFIASSILKQLELKKKVLFFITGGSSIPVCVKVSEIIRQHPHKNLTVTLTDERYGKVNHSDSNWSKLIQEGFYLPEAKLVPVLIGYSHIVTTEKFNTIIDHELGVSDYKIGLFGIGIDGHTAGILPETVAVDYKDLVCGYDTSIFSRITITPKAIEELDEAIVWTQGLSKWQVIKDLESDIDIKKQPAQILKKVPLLTIFTDYTK